MSLRKLSLVFLLAWPLFAAPHKRALLIGINDYSASHIAVAAGAPARGRDWADLSGSLNDVASMRDMLVLRRGFAPADIVTLTDQSATRDAILGAIESHLIAPAAAGDVELFYYAGHGSQVRNTRSDEPDQFDESIVPADSRRGALDIRDKELRRLFNRILDRRVRLTVMLDDCNSGSGARGLPAQAKRRGIKPDLRDAADAADAGPRPEQRGALVVSASQDFENAAENLYGGEMRGAFTWAWIRAMRDASPNESALETFLRAQARLRKEIPYQEPVIAANAAARQAPFLAAGNERSPDRAIATVVDIERDGTLLLQGGWANGFAIGTELHARGDASTRVKIVALVGLGDARARVEQGRAEVGAVLEPVGWIAEPAQHLRFWMPRVATSELPISGLAHLLVIVAAKHHVKWINDPTVTTPDYVLRRRNEHWELVAPDGAPTSFDGDDDGAERAVRAVPRDASLFMQLPARAALVARLSIPDSDVTANPADADYILVGRYANRRLTYAWVRPGMTRADRHKCSLPVRSAWLNDVEELRETAFRLRKIAAWSALDSPPSGRSHYHLAIRRMRDDTLMHGPTLAARERYSAVLRGPNLPPRVDARFVYLFVIDSNGQSILLYPRAASGSVENRFPIDPSSPPPIEIPLAPFKVSAPFGTDTYFLLTTDQPLPNPSILEWNGVRQLNARSSTQLEDLLTSIGYTSRAVATSANWSIERTVWESVR